MKDNSAKIRLICARAQEAFNHEKRLLIIVPNFEAAQYVDALLWKMPSESFMPHAIVDTFTSEWIAITMQNERNVNLAPQVLNLSPKPCQLFHEVNYIHDLFDETPEKIKFSQVKLSYYQCQNLEIVFKTVY